MKKVKKILLRSKAFLFAQPFLVASTFFLAVWLGNAFIVYLFEQGVQGSNITSYTDSVWWEMVTMLTVGYGDRFPVTPWGRFFGSVSMFSGVAATAIITAKISSSFLEMALRDRRGLVDSDLLKNHYIICGWKNEMNGLLTHILDSNPGLSPAKIILVNNVPDAEIEALHEFPKLKNIKIIRGDFFSAEVLKRAAPEKAAKILILADATPNANGNVPTITEADARTIMTAMSLNNVAKGVPIAAEILDADMAQYLKLAHVHEIIYSREYSRLLLAMASTGTGITNIFHDLLNPQGDFSIGTRDIPEEALNQNYSQLRDLLKSKYPEMTLLGVLENSGNGHRAKELALRKAQLTPNIGQLVKNLQGVKDLRFNRPIFAPKDDYIIREGAMAIVIQGKGQYESIDV
ncbi:MAG TPA: ion channel [Pseudobdellovibrionaceae bacterium]